jgi:Polyketide cyclase / dehydrase and lipid transport
MAGTASTIVIAASRTVVMSVIADFAAYPEWAGVNSATVISESAMDGRARMVRFELNAGVIRDRFALGYEWDDDQRVCWKLAEPGSVISGMSGAYVLADRDEGTEVSFELTVGVRIPVGGVLRRRVEKMIIDAALRGLKSRVAALG